MPFLNEILWFTFLFIDMCIVLIMYYFWGKVGLFSSIVLSLLIANIQVVKLVTLFGLTTTLGNILYASVFLATDILGEVYSKKEAQRAVSIGFIALILITVYMQISLLYIPAEHDTSQIHLAHIFGFLPRIMLASLVAYACSQYIDVFLYHHIRRVTNSRFLWLRNSGSTLLSQLIDSILFTSVAFIGVYPVNVLFEIALTTYLFKAIVAIVDTPFIYGARYIYQKKYTRDTVQQ